MNWKGWLSAIFSSSSFFLVLFGWDYLNGKVPHFSDRDYLALLVLLLTSSMGTVGFGELDRGGFQKVKRNLGYFFIALLVIPVMFLFARNRLHWQIAVSGSSCLYFLNVCFILLAAVLPLALYLNRKQNKSTRQPTTDNAS
jgi:drug/metabolite transporter (DMT)-like permease